MSSRSASPWSRSCPPGPGASPTCRRSNGDRRSRVQRGVRARRDRPHRALGRPGRHRRVRRPPRRGDRRVRRRHLRRTKGSRAPDGHLLPHGGRPGERRPRGRLLPGRIRRLRDDQGQRGPGRPALGPRTAPVRHHRRAVRGLPRPHARTHRAPREAPLVSFDVNHRAGLWRDADGPRVLLDLARGADIVFVGDDEARAAWGLSGARAIREALPEPAVLVVKQGGDGATVFERAAAGRAASEGGQDAPTPPRSYAPCAST